MSVRPRYAVVLAVAAVVAVSATARFLASLGVAAPWIAPDEAIYGLLGRSLYEHGSLSVLGGPTPYYSLVYPLLIGLPLFAGDVADGVLAVKAVQALLMSATAAVVYPWARSVASTGWALLAATLSVLGAGLAYSGLLMTEAVFYPAMTLALFLLVRALARPTLGRQALFWAAAALAVATRLQGLVLLPLAVAAVLLATALGRRPALLRQASPTLVLAAGLASAGAAAWAAGVEVAGAYTVALDGYAPAAAARHVSWHVAALFLLSAGVPLIALAALTATAVRERLEDALAAAVAVALAACICLTLQVGVFASRWVGHLAERDLLAAAPPLFVVFAAWLGRGVPRPQPWTAVLAGLIAVPALLLPMREVTTREASLDSFSSIPLRLLAEATSERTLELVWLLGVAAAVLLAVLVPARARAALAAAVAAGLIALSAFSAAEVRTLSRADERWWFADAGPTWVDRHAGGPVTYVHAGTALWGGVWKTAFWNRRIAEVALIPEAPLPGPIPFRQVAPRFDGRLYDLAGETIDTDLVVAPEGMAFVGERLFGFGPSADQPGLALWRVQGPARLSFWARGVADNGDILGRAEVDVFDCAGGELQLTLLGKEGVPVEVSVAGEPVLRLTVPPGSVWRGGIPAPANERRCLFAIDSPGLLGSTRIEFLRPPSGG